jgi:hypothetical protein
LPVGNINTVDISEWGTKMPLMNNFNDKYFFNEYDEPFDIVALMAEEKILEAIKNRDAENLSCKGKPLEFDNMTYVAKVRRVGYKILKNAGFLPVEVELKKEIYTLEKKISECTDQSSKKGLMKQLAEKNVECDIYLKRGTK